MLSWRLPDFSWRGVDGKDCFFSALADTRAQHGILGTERWIPRRLLFSFAKTKVGMTQQTWKINSVQALEETFCSLASLLNPSVVAHSQYFPGSFAKEKAFREIPVLFLSVGEEVGAASHWKVGKSLRMKSQSQWESWEICLLTDHRLYFSLPF